MSLFRRFPHELDNWAPMFDMLDSYANRVANAGSRGQLGFSPSALSSSFSFESFTPKFDVKESKDGYELHGELPGIEQKDINIEFTDAQTLVVKGQTQQAREKGQHPSGLIEHGAEQAEQAKITETGEKGASYHQPTVEDESTQKTGANSDAAESAEGQSSEVAQQTEPKQPEQSQSRYWIREMSSGSFRRTFSFQTRVDQDAVKASLKNGVLSILVPKAQAPQSKRITVE